METTAQKTVWKLDKSHSNISFSISHFVIATVKGQFDSYEGEVSGVKSSDFQDAKLNLVIKSSSINTNDEKRDQHLKTADFFDVEHYPEITFVSTSFKSNNEKDYKVTGKLTINGITKDVQLDALYKGSFVHPQYKKTMAVFDISTEIPRFDFNIGKTYPAAALGDMVKLNSTVELAQQ